MNILGIIIDTPTKSSIRTIQWIWSHVRPHMRLRLLQKGGSIEPFKPPWICACIIKWNEQIHCTITLPTAESANRVQLNNNGNTVVVVVVSEWWLWAHFSIVRVYMYFIYIASPCIQVFFNYKCIAIIFHQHNESIIGKVVSITGKNFWEILESSLGT